MSNRHKPPLLLPDASPSVRRSPPDNARSADPYRASLGCFDSKPFQPANPQPPSDTVATPPSGDSGSKALQPMADSCGPPKDQERTVRGETTEEGKLLAIARGQKFQPMPAWNRDRLGIDPPPKQPVEDSTGSGGNSSPKKPVQSSPSPGSIRASYAHEGERGTPASPEQPLRGPSHTGKTKSPPNSAKQYTTGPPKRPFQRTSLRPGTGVPSSPATMRPNARPVHQHSRPATRSNSGSFRQPSRHASFGSQRPITGPQHTIIGSTDQVFRSSALTPPRNPPTASPHSPFRSSSSPSPMRSISSGRQGFSVIQGDKSWKYLPECAIQLSGLPMGFSTWDVYQLLSKEGYISRIQVHRNGSAFVVFCPPPNQAFWEFPLRLRNHAERLRVEYVPPNRSYQIPSPVNPDKLYCERTILSASELEFGFMYDADSMMAMSKISMANIARKNDRGIQITLNLERKEIDVQATIGLKRAEPDKGLWNYRYRFRLPISQLQRVYEVRVPGDRKCELVIPFETPPAFFRQTEDIAGTHKDGRFWNEWQTWSRQTNVLHFSHSKTIETTAVDLRNRHAVVDIGRWTIYRFVFGAEKDVTTTKGYSEFLEALKDHNIEVILLQHFDVKDRTEPLFWDLLDSAHRQSLHSQTLMGGLDTSTIPLEFPVRYQLEVCLSHGWMNEHNITREFLMKLSAMDADKARHILEKTADKQCRTYEPMDVFKTPMKDSGKINLPKYCVYARSATITPSMVYVNTPTAEISNRVVRYRLGLQDRFLRVKFTDEKVEGRINSQDDDKFEELFLRIKRAMTHGIIVGDRYYEFLAFGNSQFREHGAYFFSPTADCTVEDLRKWMGNFRPIKSVSKYAARLGQCFSTSRAIAAGTNVTFTEIEDIKHGDYCFTDGVGKISAFLALMVAHEFGLPAGSDDYPSLVQFRLGGCKGVLAVSPDCKSNEIMVRPSQKKFDAIHRGLEIVRISSFATACLNRQLIIILSTLGIPDRIFTDMQQAMLAELSRAMTDSSLAVEKLRRNIDLNQMSLVLAGMIADGFMDSKDPFMISVLHLWRSYTIKYLKEKARIVVEQGAFLLGCVDETTTLRGHQKNPQDDRNATRKKLLETLPEIFLQISDQDKKGSYKVIEGVCILARNPSLHPGDVRVVRAVNVPALHHLKNVVVLPKVGDRDIANMCSGGDLDGDDYLVIWEPALIPQRINTPAMNYQAEPSREVSGDVTIEQVIDFYITYMKNDSLGKIANAHLATADWSPRGVLDDKCLQLAELHSCAVDFPKNGNPAKMGKELRPKKYPHFMESKYRTKDKIYLSRKILGQLYDQVERADFTPFYDNPFDERILNAYQSNDDTLSRVARIKELYDADVRRIQAQHGIKTEFEVWSTFILEHNLEFKDYTFTEEMGRITGALKKKFQDMCIEQAGATGINDMQKLKPFVAAMYQVTAQEIAAALKECERTKKVGGREVPDRKKIIGQMPLMSFPWIFVSQLGEIANPTVIRSIPVASRGLQHRTKKHYPVFDDMLAGAGAIHTKYGTVQPGEMLMVELEEASVSVYEDQGHAAMVEQGVTDTARPMQPTGKPIMDDSVANGPHPPSNTKFDGVNEGVSRTTEESQNTVGNVNMTSASYTETEKPKELVDLTDVTGSDGMYTPPIENYRAAAFIPTQLEFKLMTTDVAASGPTTPTLDSVSTAPDSDVCDDEFEREDVLIDFDDKPSGLEALRSL